MSDDQKPQAPEPVLVRSVFGKTIDVSQIEGVAVSELYDLMNSLLRVEGGDPDMEYGWLVHDDPFTSVKLRKGMWELVDTATDKVIAPSGLIEKDGTIRVRELILAKMPKVQYRALKNAARAIALRREIAVEGAYKDRIRGIAGQIDRSGQETASPSLTKTEKVKTVRQ